MLKKLIAVIRRNPAVLITLTSSVALAVADAAQHGAQGRQLVIVAAGAVVGVLTRSQVSPAGGGFFKP